MGCRSWVGEPATGQSRSAHRFPRFVLLLGLGWPGQLALFCHQWWHETGEGREADMLARAEGVVLVVETGNGTMVNSNYTARRLIDELDAKDALQVLWDPANNCWCHERAYPEGYDAVRGGYLGHVHIKDVKVNTPRATLEIRPMGEGQLGPLFGDIAEALRADGYDGVVSFESVYHPGDGDFEAGFRQNIGAFKALFG